MGLSSEAVSIQSGPQCICPKCTWISGNEVHPSHLPSEHCHGPRCPHEMSFLPASLLLLSRRAWESQRAPATNVTSSFLSAKPTESGENFPSYLPLVNRNRKGKTRQNNKATSMTLNVYVVYIALKVTVLGGCVFGRWWIHKSATLQSGSVSYKGNCQGLPPLLYSEHIRSHCQPKWGSPS